MGGLDHFIDIKNFLDSDLFTVLIDDTELKNFALDLDSQKLDIQLFSLLEIEDNLVYVDTSKDFLNFINFLLSDYRTLIIYQRMTYQFISNEIDYISKLAKVIWLHVINKNPKYIIFSSTPHRIESWIYAKVFEYLNLNIYILDSVPLLERIWLRRGIDHMKILDISNTGYQKNLTDQEAEFLKSQFNEEGNEDHNIKVRISPEKGALRQFFSDILASFKYSLPRFPLRIYEAILKLRLRLFYNSNSDKECSGSYCIFYLHYQPERSTLPEGNLFLSQIMAAQILSSKLHPNMTLYIKEHPSTWSFPLDIRFRNKNYYRKLLDLPNVKLLSMQANNFSSIDNASFVATISGKIGFQALLREKPVIYFGNASFSSHKGSIPIKEFLACKNLDNLKSFNNNMANMNQSFIKWIVRCSFLTSGDYQNWKDKRKANFKEAYKHILPIDLDLVDVYDHKQFN